MKTILSLFLGMCLMANGQTADQIERIAKLQQKLIAEDSAKTAKENTENLAALKSEETAIIAKVQFATVAAESAKARKEIKDREAEKQKNEAVKLAPKHNIFTDDLEPFTEKELADMKKGIMPKLRVFMTPVKATVIQTQIVGPIPDQRSQEEMNREAAEVEAIEHTAQNDEIIHKLEMTALDHDEAMNKAEEIRMEAARQNEEQKIETQNLRRAIDAQTRQIEMMQMEELQRRSHHR